MRMEEIKNDFPKMPDEMRAMVEREVAKQMQAGNVQGMRTERNGNRKGKGRKRPMRKTAVVGLAAAMVLGTTVLAGTGLYRLYIQQEGEYGVRTKVGEISQETEAAQAAGASAGEALDADSGQAADTADAQNASSSAALDIPDIKVVLNYLPEGMIQTEETKYHYETDTACQGGFSFVVYAMDLGDDAFQMLDTDVVSQEEIQVGNHDAVYLERQRNVDGSTSGILYVFYPESHHVLEMMIGPDVSREEALKIAEGMELVELEEGESPDIGMNLAWSTYLESQEEVEVEAAFDYYDTVTEEDMGNTHQVGEAFPVTVYAEDEGGEYLRTEVAVKITSVQTADDLSLLNDSEYIPDAWLEAVEENGSLPSEELQYVKRGDGIDTLDEIVKTETVAQKLVWMNVEYTNTGDQTLKNVVLETGLIPIQKEGETYSLYDRGTEESDGAWDLIQGTGVACCGELGMGFLSVHTDYGNGGNYIETLEPGETADIQMAWIVDEDQLEHLYLTVGSFANEIIQKNLDTGYVDLGL